MFIHDADQQQTMIRSGSPLRAPPSQRPRRDAVFEWKRFTTDGNNLQSFVIRETPHPDIFKNIMNRHGDDFADPDKMDQIRAFQSVMENCAWSRLARPMQKEIDCFPKDYQGARLIGRSYGISCQFLPSKITNTLYFDTHRYLDCSNCFPTILLNAGRHLDIDALKGYVTNREAVFQGFYNDHGIKKADVKTAIVSMIGACPRLPPMFGLGAGKEHEARVFAEHPFILQFQSDLVKIAVDIEERYPLFAEGIAEHSRRTGSSDKTRGVLLHYFCADIENSIMRTTIEVIQDGWDQDLARNIVWKFDGVMFPKIMVSEEDATIQKIQHAIQDKLGLSIQFSFKDIGTPSAAYQDCAAQHIEDAYQRWKKGFDRRFVKFLCPDKYGMLRDDGSYQLLSYGQNYIGGSFGFINSDENQEFIKTWSVDPEKRVYQGMDFAPPPRVVREGYLNTYRGLRAETLSVELDASRMDQYVQPWKDHISIMCGHVPANIEYFHKYMAHIIQFPGIKTEVIIFLRSIQGTGKDQMFKFLEKIVGPGMCHRARNIPEVCGSMSACLENKLLVCLSECNYKDFKDHGETLKDMTTRPTFTVKQKYIPEYTARCNVNLFMFTNQFGGMNMDVNDRRPFCIEADGKYAQDSAYHTPFAAYIEDDANVVAVYRYYKNMDLTGFDVRNGRPITDVQRTMASQTSNYGAWFLKANLDDWISFASPTGQDFKKVSDDYLRVRSSVFFDAFRGFCQEHKIQNMDTNRKQEQFVTQLLAEIGAKLTKYCPEGVIGIENQKSNGIRFKKFYIPGLQEYLAEAIPECDNGMGNEEEEPPIPFVPSIRGGGGGPVNVRNLKAYRNKPGHAPSYVVKENAEIVFGSEDLEEINKFLGEAYLTQKADGRWVLVHQHRNNTEFPVGEDIEEPIGKTRLEAKYPWYKHNRLHIC